MLADTRPHHRFDSSGRHRRSPLPDRNPELDSEKDNSVEFGQRHASNQRSSFLGFEMETELVWNNWDLGRESTKTLIIRNTQPKLQRVSFRPPLSKYFTSLARQKIVLSPGISFSIPVTFKPLNRCDYEDTIEFQGRNDTFQVLLRAPVPCHAIEVPDSVLMPLCAVQQITQTTFMLKNVSKLTTFFHWEYSQPFMLSPEKGYLKPDQELNISVAFHPQEALIHQQPVSCRFGTQADNLEGCCAVLLQGIAKHPYLQFKTQTHQTGSDHIPVLDFGGVAVGQTFHSHFEIYNPSPVPVWFTLSRFPGGIPLLGSVFGCDLTSAEVPPGASVKAATSFTPTTVNSTSVEYLSVLFKGAINTSLLKLNGKGLGPQVLMSSSIVDFGIVEPEQAVTHAVELVNSSLAEAVFQWDIDCCGYSVFSIQPAGGSVPPQSHITLNVTYKPRQPILHYRRVACLILHRKPVYLNLIGNCLSEKPFKQLILESSNIHETDQEQDSVACVAVTPMFEYFLSCLSGKDPLSASPLLSVVPSEVVFNQKLYTLPKNLNSQKPITVTNHSKIKLRLEWTAGPDLSFSVSPLFCELPPLKSTSFRLTYCPKQLNTLHGVQMECFAYPMDSDQCNGSVLPSCVTVRAIGHSYEPGKKLSVPQCSLGPRLVEFPPVNIASYRSILLQNKGNLPLTFHLNPEHDQELSKATSLVMVPSCGLISPHSHQILSLRTIPTEDSPKEGFNVQLHLNASKCTEKLAVISKSECPCVSFEGEGKLRFNPTAVFSLTRRLHHIRNLSRQVLWFQWRIPEQNQGLISVEPDTGVLQPNERLGQMWSFTPLEEKTYTFKPILTISLMQFPDYDNLHLPLEVAGAGCIGYIQAEEAVTEVKDVLVGRCQTISIPVINKSQCTVSFCVTVEQKLLDKGVCDPNIDQCALQVHNERMTIASNSTALLQSTITPHHKAQYMWIISYQTINANSSLSSAKLLCKIRAKGVYPTLQISDVCGRGSLSQCSKKHLWRLLSLNHLNESLQCSPCPTELTYATPTRHSLNHTPPVFTKAIVNISFSAAPLNSEPSTVMLMLNNPGTIPVEWAFLFPEDQQLDLEFWAETGEFSGTELYQMKVQDNHLFNVTPRSGRLMASQQRAVTFTYSHDFPGTDRFPVLLKISYGREIMLTFQGITVEVERPYLHFASSTHVFASVATGDCNPPKQMYQLFNRGAVPVQYEVDKAVFSQIQDENFNHPVLICLNPDGEIPPGEAAMLKWVFSPLEAKLYQMDIPIHVINGESTIVRFEGCGINSLTQNLSMSNHCTDVSLLPCWQREPFSEKPIFLSEDSVDFGGIVVSSQLSKMLFLNNNTHDRVLFEWVLPKQNNQPQVLEIFPNRGGLSPGETAPLVLTLLATKYPTHYQFDLICKITSEAAFSQYNLAVQKMEEDRERLKHEFTITDKAPKENKVVLTEKTLPPIRSSNDCNTVRSLSTTGSRVERRALRKLAGIQKDPESPKPCLLSLCVTAQSYGLLEFLTQSPDQLTCQYRPNQPDKTKSQNIYKESSTAQGIKKDISFHVVTLLLRDILEDAAIVDDLILESVPDTYKILETPSSWPSPEPASSNNTEPQKLDEKSVCVSEDGAIKLKPVRPELAHLTEQVLLCTLQNLMMEVIRGELDPTLHPRTIILPSSAR
ncbi:cilia- and flagella-associated protein 65 [Periophthalmus magnuspinnatus]|uniref:cilia- and flagella-associated protein 65 n=1 Tax=Periophthalmus magnuspinnatus TaxID=409849 RepID=UPI002436C9D2|nr:cilia- and flagella-associated protein 65 [Periophthalmus magnuspinnatus]